MNHTVNKSLAELCEEQQEEINTIWKVVILFIVWNLCLSVLLLITNKESQYLQGRVLLLEQRFVGVEQEHSIVTNRGTR